MLICTSTDEAMQHSQRMACSWTHRLSRFTPCAQGFAAHALLSVQRLWMNGLWSILV